MPSLIITAYMVYRRDAFLNYLRSKGTSSIFIIAEHLSKVHTFYPGSLLKDGRSHYVEEHDNSARSMFDSGDGVESGTDDDDATPAVSSLFVVMDGGDDEWPAILQLPFHGFLMCSFEVTGYSSPTCER